MTIQPKELLYHIQKWLNDRQRLIYTPVRTIEFHKFDVNRWMPYEEAVNGTFSPIEEGMPWGEMWSYAWFKGAVSIPPDLQGERLVLRLELGAESTVHVNGRLAGSKDLQHHEITLTREAAGGESFEIMAEAYAGHEGKRPVFGRSSLETVNEELYQFYIDLHVLYQLRNGLEPDSLRVSEIDQGFLKLLAHMDWNVKGRKLTEMAREGRAIMKPLLDCFNGSTVPKLFMMGQSHLDIAWLWPLEETKRKIARTMSNQLALLEEYPEYRYTQSQPYLFQMVKDLYPELYGRMKEGVAKGRIIPEGGMWVEPDTVIPSGESLIRQFLYGKRFFMEEFGVDNRMLWLPDVFGYSGNLPQIMRKCGVPYFASVKMSQTYDNVAESFPYNTFTWEGIDGSEVIVHLLDYGPFPNPTDVSYALFQWKERIQKEGISTRLVQFGYGDGGGGATRDDLEFLRRMENLEGVPQTVISSPIDYYEDLQERGMPEARYVGELYYPAHRGTLTSQAKMKQGNRTSEFALREAELWSLVAAVKTNYSYPRETINQVWKTLLLNQFHDILPGTSIERVHDEAEQAFRELLQTADELIRNAALALTDGSNEAITAFNSMPWDRQAVVELPESFQGAATANGQGVPTQKQAGRLYARVHAPAMGYCSLFPGPADIEYASTVSELAATERMLENSLLRLTVNEFGEITSIYDKESRFEWVNGKCNQFLMYRDQPSSYDAWEIDRRYEQSELQLPEKAAIHVIANGPLFAALRVERVLNESLVSQEIYLEAGSRRVEFRTKVDWKEKHKLLKVGFDVDLHANEALHEIQYGYMKRPNHHSRPHESDQFEVSQHKWSTMMEGDRCFSLLNDCKYGLSVKGRQMNLTLLRASTYPDEHADEGLHQFTYAIHLWNDGFMKNPVIQEAYELQRPVLVIPGQAEQSFRLLASNNPNIIVDSVKLAEDGSSDWIVRIYEAKGAKARTVLSMFISCGQVYETDMLEREIIQELQYDSNEILLTFKPFEVKTLRFSR